MKRTLITGFLLNLLFVIFCNSVTAQIVSVARYDANTVKSTKYDVLPVKSIIYNDNMNVFVYSSKGKLSTEEKLPVIYMPNINETDSSFYNSLDKMVNDITLHPSIIVGIVKTDKIQKLNPSITYMDPKKLFEDQTSIDETYFKFIDQEVIPLIQKSYNCSQYKVLCADGNATLANYILNNHSNSFNAYLSQSPFVLFDGKENLESAKVYFSLLQSNKKDRFKGSVYDVEWPDEATLKNGQKPIWLKE